MNFNAVQAFIQRFGEKILPARLAWL